MRRARSENLIGWYLSAAAALLLPVLAAAKSPIERIEVAEGEKRVLSIDGVTAREFTLWSGPGTKSGGTTTIAANSHDFADWMRGAVAPPNGLPVFDIFFFCEACEPARRDTWRCYGVRYAMNADGQGGFIQIPASDDERFALNVQTIYRGVEGQWFRASPKWEKLIRPAIESARRKP